VEPGRRQVTMLDMRLHASHVRLKTHTQNMYYLLVFHCKNGCMNAPHCHLICTLPALCQSCYTNKPGSDLRRHSRYIHFPCGLSRRISKFYSRIYKDTVLSIILFTTTFETSLQTALHTFLCLIFRAS
jgi:hypothetical protein